MRLIDADNLMEHVYRDRLDSRELICQMVENEPTVYPKHGKWIRKGEPPMYVIECSICGQRYFSHALQPLANYCSMCGTYMKEVTNV